MIEKRQETGELDSAGEDDDGTCDKLPLSQVAVGRVLLDGRDRALQAADASSKPGYSA